MHLVFQMYASSVHLQTWCTLLEHTRLGVQKVSIKCMHKVCISRRGAHYFILHFWVCNKSEQSCPKCADSVHRVCIPKVCIKSALSLHKQCMCIPFDDHKVCTKCVRCRLCRLGAHLTQPVTGFLGWSVGQHMAHELM